MDRLKEEYSTLVRIQMQLNLLMSQLKIVSVKKTLDEHGVEKARRAWQGGEDFEGAVEQVEPYATEQYRWDAEDFEEEFNAYVDQRIFQNSDVDTVEEANQRISEQTEELEAELEEEFGDEAQMEFKEFRKLRFVKNLFWRLARDYDTVEHPVTGEDLELSLKRADVERAQRVPTYEGEENLRECVSWPEDSEAFYEALGSLQSADDEEMRERMMDPPEDDEDFLPGSETSGTQDERSRTGTPSTSATGTGTESS